MSSHIKLIDGGIIGGAPKLKDDDKWQTPSIPLSGPTDLAEVQPAGRQLAELLTTRHISPDIGAASGLKMCFASLTKGFTALAIQSFTTAHNLGVLPELNDHLSKYNAKTFEMTKSLTVMPPKAYRWVREMQEIGDTFADDGGFSEQERIFGAIANVYDLVANGTELGLEKTEERKRGTSTEDVAQLMTEGIKKRKEKTD